MNTDSKFCNSVVCFVLVLCCVAVGPEHYSKDTYQVLSVSTFLFGFMSVMYGIEALITFLINLCIQKRGNKNE